jgi:Pyruvate/2-oxoacid:ferredoxin oxidoreductase delta subunit
MWQTESGSKGKAVIDPLFCTGCEVCTQLCKLLAIKGNK